MQEGLRLGHAVPAGHHRHHRCRAAGWDNCCVEYEIAYQF